MKHFFIILCFLFTNNFANSSNSNSYGFLQNIEFKLYTKDIPPQKALSNQQTTEEILMYDIIHAVWENGKWTAYTTNKTLLGIYKVGSPTIIQNSNGKKLFFIANFPGSKGGTDLYMSEFTDGIWSKPRNMGKNINTPYNESNPGMLDENTLTYSTNGIIKKVDINTFVIDNGGDQQFDFTAQTNNTVANAQKLAEQKLAEQKLTQAKAELEKKIAEQKLAQAKGEQTNTEPENLIDKIMQTAQKLNAQNEAELKAETALKDKTTTAPKVTTPTTTTSKVVETSKPKTTIPTVPKEITPVQTTSTNIINDVESVGKLSTPAAKAMFPLAIQIGAYMNPNWNIIKPIGALGQLSTFQNESNLNVVWLTGFSTKEEMLSMLSKVKANSTFKNAFIVK